MKGNRSDHSSDEDLDYMMKNKTDFLPVKKPKKTTKPILPAIDQEPSDFNNKDLKEVTFQESKKISNEFAKKLKMKSSKSPSQIIKTIKMISNNFDDEKLISAIDSLNLGD
jgi:hypothetical protein